MKNLYYSGNYLFISGIIYILVDIYIVIIANLTNLEKIPGIFAGASVF